MVEAHPCLMLSQEGDLDNRSYQRHTALCVCVCTCTGVCVFVRPLSDSVSFPGINGLECITPQTFRRSDTELNGFTHTYTCLYLITTLKLDCSKMQQHETESAAAPNEVKQARLSFLYFRHMLKAESVCVLKCSCLNHTFSPYTFRQIHPFKATQTFIDFSVWVGTT